MKKKYPVVLTPAGENDGWYCVNVPGFIGAHTQGNGVDDALEMAYDIIGLLGTCLEDSGEAAPEPLATEPPHEANEIVRWVEIDLDEYRREVEANPPRVKFEEYEIEDVENQRAIESVLDRFDAVHKDDPGVGKSDSGEPSLGRAGEQVYFYADRPWHACPLSGRLYVRWWKELPASEGIEFPILVFGQEAAEQKAAPEKLQAVG